MQKIGSKTETVRELLDNKYNRDYYQRGYVWGPDQVRELISDLINKFKDNYDKLHDREEVKNYGHYFLGSIIICEEEGKRFIVDGQQRLTTLTLILIFLHRVLEDESQKGQIAGLIFSQRYGSKSFNLDIPERKAVMEALYSGDSLESFTKKEQRDSIRNIAIAWKNIERFASDILSKQSFPYFADWLLENVCLVEITTSIDEDAYTVFETMNDRGVTLTYTEMLRGYLLSKIIDFKRRNNATEIWDERIQRLKQISKEAESEAIKAWLRSQYVGFLDSSESVRDFDAIGSEFHRWVRERKDDLGLESSSDFADFIERDFEFYTDWYYRLRHAADSLTDALKHGLECVYYNAQHNNFTLQYPILLAPLRVNDSDEENLQKAQIVSRYLDILIYRRVWNRLPVTQSTMADLMPDMLPIIRDKSSSELRDILSKGLEAEALFVISEIPTSQQEESPCPVFAKNPLFNLTQTRNNNQMRLILARMTDYVAVQSGQPSRYPEYVKRGKNSYEVEHIWAKHHGQHDEFPHEHDFLAYRDRIGGLLLLPKKSNASYGDLPYSEKREHYLKENLLAQSLHEQTYKRNPGFQQFIKDSGLPFHAHANFQKSDLDERQQLYLQLAEQIWTPESLKISYGQGPPWKSTAIIKSNTRSAGIWTIDRVKNLVPAARRVDYQTLEASRINKFYKLIAESLDFIQKQDWPLTAGFRTRYCGFYRGPHPIFGVNLYGQPRFAIWITKEEAERFSSQCIFDTYYFALKSTIYPSGTTLDTLRPILEFAYKKHRGY